MRDFANITLHDPIGSKSPVNALDRFWVSLLKDPRDLPFVHLTLRISFTLVPLTILLFLTQGWVWWLVFAAHFYLGHLYFKGPFGLMLHCAIHRPLFKSDYGFLNNYLPWFLAPFFGHTPETYRAHHIGMHHAENNLEPDGSCTMGYQRDDLRDFGKYVGRFLLFGVYDMYQYHRKLNRKFFTTRILAGEIFFYTMVVVLCFVNFTAAFWAFIFPLFVFRVVAMLGNWSQHSFVDAEDPGNAYKNSGTCINHKYNHKCWNDGYHISHHILPHLHWTEHPQHLIDKSHEYAENKALVFENLDFLRIFLLLMAKNYDKLADHVVNINGTFESKEEIIALMKERTAKILVPESVPA
jgi:fatty acid desaturase